MKLKTISLSKSETFGVTIGGKTKYTKVATDIIAEIEEGETYAECYNELSGFIEAALHHEKEVLRERNKKIK